MNLDQLNTEFERAKPQLKSFLLRLTASIHDAEDIVQDTYIKAHARLHTFRGDSALKTWIFSIASNLAKDNLKARRRWTENVTDIARAAALNDPQFFREAMHIAYTSPHGQFEVREHISFCLACISKSLPLEQQICLLLREVYEFKISELAQIMDTTEAITKYYLHAARSKMVTIFDNRCALVKKDGICHQCSELNGIFNPKQNFEEEKNKIEFARKAGDPDREYLLDLRLNILKEIDPFTSNGSELELHHLSFNEGVMEKYFERNEA